MLRALLLVLLLCTPVWADLAQGVEALRKGRYAEAVDKLAPLVEEGRESPSLFYNLGLAYHRLNDKGRARAYYEKARLLAPWDRDVWHNLGRLRSTLNDSEPDAPPLRRFAELIPFRVLAGGFAVVHLLFWVSLIAYRRRARELYFWTTGTLAAFLVLIGLLLAVRWRTPPQAAIVPESTLLKNGPGREFTDSLSLHAGTLVSVLQQEGDWVEVEALGRVRAWVRSEDLCRVP